MVNVNQKIVNISKHLQTLTTTEYSPQVQEAVNKQDKHALAAVCKKAKIPTLYVSSIVSLIMSVSPNKWPDDA